MDGTNSDLRSSSSLCALCWSGERNKEHIQAPTGISPDAGSLQPRQHSINPRSREFRASDCI